MNFGKIILRHIRNIIFGRLSSTERFKECQNPSGECIPSHSPQDKVAGRHVRGCESKELLPMHNRKTFKNRKHGVHKVLKGLGVGEPVGLLFGAG
jgi:hypothetical protein